MYIENQKIINTYKGHSNFVNSVAFDGNANIVSGSQDETIIIWNTDFDP